MLLRASKRAAPRDVELVVACVPAPLLRILEMTGADQVLQVFDTVVKAEAELGSIFKRILPRAGMTRV
ncbi:STAS domain-containing protein [Streptomyces sviceus]|uniref:STAS domain-containing protein n=1 Tax=Streptomyces sviceus TaxID=285530 RepID=UPI0036BCD53C